MLILMAWATQGLLSSLASQKEGVWSQSKPEHPPSLLQLLPKSFYLGMLLPKPVLSKAAPGDPQTAY